MPYTPPLLARGLAVLAGVLLSHFSQAADPGVGEWTTFGNGPSHSGFYPKTIGSQSFTPGWTKSFPTSINQVAVSGDSVYATTSGYFTAGMRAFAMRVSDGSEKWSFPLPDAFSINPPTYSNGRVYFQRGNHGSDTHLWSLDAASGALRFAAPHAAQWERYAAPTIADGGAFVNGGYYGGMYGFDAVTGSQRFFISNLAQEDGWTPSYADGVVYACVNGIFTAYNPQTGAQLWTRDLKTTSTGSSTYWNDGNIPVISQGKAAIIGGGRLLVIDLATRTQLWSLPGMYSGTPAFAEGKVYAFLGPEVKAYDAANGTLLGTYSAPGVPSLMTQPLVTKDLVLAASETTTFVFDRATFALRQTLNAGGSLSYAAGRLYAVNTPWSSPTTLKTFTVVPEEADPATDPLPPPPAPEPHPNPDRPLGATTVAWLDAMEAGEIMYFLFDNPAKIERYNLAAGDWLAPISLPTGPKGFTVSSTAIYVSFGTSISKFPLDGTTETVLTTTATSIKSLFEHNSRLYLANQNGSGFLSIDPTLGTFLGARNYFYGIDGITVASSKNTILGRSTTVSPSDIIRISLDADGSFGTQTDSPYHGTYPNATRTFLFPGEARVVDDSGLIYSVSDLTYLGSFAGAFNDIDFDGDSAVVLRQNNTLVGYSAALAETGRKTITANQLRISVAGGFVHSFARLDGRGVVATKTALSEIVPADPGTGIDPTVLTYTPDAIEFGGDTVFLLSKLHQSVFRWSISEQRYLSTIKLSEIPQRIAYSGPQNRLYLGYASGRIGKVDLATSVTESAFVNLAKAPTAMVAAGDFMYFAHTASSPAPGQFIYAADATLVTSKADFYTSDAAVWNETLRRVFYVTGSSSYEFRAVDVDLEGKFGQTRNGSSSTYNYTRTPFRIAPDGSRAVFSNALVYNGSDLTYFGTLPVPTPPASSTYPYASGPQVIDSAWLNGTLHTVRGSYAFGSSTADGGMIESWNSSLAAIGSGAARGTPLRLNALSDGLLLVSLLEGRPVFVKFNAALVQTSSEPGNNPPPTSPITRANPARNLGPAIGPWLDSAKYAGIAYFLFDSPAKIERYDLATGTWLDPISLPDGPRSLALGPGGIYVGFGKLISRFSFDGATETILISTAVDAKPLAEHNGFVYIASGQQWSSRLGAADADTGVIVSETTPSYSMSGVSFSALRGKLFGRTSNVSPSDIVQVVINPDGTLGTQSDSPYHSAYPGATRTFLFPGDARVVDDSGIIYSTSDLSYLGSLAGAFNDADFEPNVTVVLRENKTLVSYSTALAETGRKTIASNQLRLYLGGGFAHSFARQDGRGVVETKTSLTDIGPVNPGPGIDPTSVNYTPDAIEFGGDTVFLLSKVHQSVFRWSISQQRYLSTIALSEVPTRITYSATHNRLYLSYPTGRVGKVELATEITESAFVNLPKAPMAMLAAGDFVFFGIYSSYPSPAFLTYTADGTLAGSRSEIYSVQDYAWNQAVGRIFYTTGSSSYDFRSVAMDATGNFSDARNGSYNSANPYFTSPFRISPDGTRSVFSNGVVYNATTHLYFGKLAVPQPPATTTYPYTAGPAIIDSVWFNGTLHTVRGDYPFGGSVATGGTIESWAATLANTGSGASRGTPLRLNALSDGLLLVSMLDGHPVFAKYNTLLQQVSSEPGNNLPPSGPITRDNPERALGPTSGPWIDLCKHEGIAYFLFDQPAKIERYQLATGNWLAPISLPDNPKYLAVGPSGIFVSFGKSLSRFNFSGTTETILLSTAADVRVLVERNERIYIATTGTVSGAFRFGAVSANTGILVNEASYSYRMTGISFAPVTGKFYGRTAGLSPSDIVQVSINSDGSFGTQTESPYHGTYPNATRTFVFPGEGRVLDNAGSIYSSSLQYLGAFNGAFTDADFSGDLPIVLQNGSVIAYSAALQELGRKALPANTLRLYATNDTVISFTAAANRGVEALRTALSDLTTPNPPEPIDPTNLVYTPDAIELGNNGIVYLLSKLHQSVFRWSIAQQQYVQTIPLANVPKYMAYSSTLDRLYLVDADGVISKVDVGVERVVRPFATLSSGAWGLQTAEDLLFATGTNPSGGYIHYVYSAAGAKISESSSLYKANGYTWSPANRRLYYLRDNASPYHLYSEAIDVDGVLGQRLNSSYQYWNVFNPVRVSPNGSTLVLGNGDLYNALTLERLGTLSVPPPAIVAPMLSQEFVYFPSVADAAWFADKLYTVRTESAGSGLIHRWKAPGQREATANLPGEPIRLFALPASLLAISIKDSRPVFTTVAPNFGQSDPDPEPIDFTEFAGTFAASLSSDAGTSGPVGGMVKLTLSAGGMASGVVKIAGKTVPFQVTFDQYGNATVQFELNGTHCTLTLSLVMSATGPRVEGSLESNSWSLALNGARAMDAAKAGRHLFILTDSSAIVRDEVPPVIGRGSLMITSKGRVRVKASLLLGGAASQGSMLLEDGSIVLNLMTAKKTSFIAGTVRSVNESLFDWSGTLRYFKQAMPNAIRYAEEIDTAINLRGDRYRQTSPLLPVDKDRTVTLIFDSGDLEETLAIEATLDPSGVIFSESDFRLDFATINPATGIVRGFFIHPVTEDWVSFSAVVSQKRGEAQGGFLGPVHGGQVRIVPGTIELP